MYGLHHTTIHINLMSNSMHDLSCLYRYIEDQYDLARWEDLSVSRQDMFDDTYHYIPTQGWMILPFIQYHGGEGKGRERSMEA